MYNSSPVHFSYHIRAHSVCTDQNKHSNTLSFFPVKCVPRQSPSSPAKTLPVYCYSGLVRLDSWPRHLCLASIAYQSCSGPLLFFALSSPSSLLPPYPLFLLPSSSHFHSPQKTLDFPSHLGRLINSLSFSLISSLCLSLSASPSCCVSVKLQQSNQTNNRLFSILLPLALGPYR